MTEDTGREEPEPQATDRGLAPERTALAWLRTAMSVLVAALVLVRFAAQRNVVLAAASAALAIPLSATVAVFASRRFIRAERRFKDGGRVPDGVLPAALTALAALMGVVGIGYVLLG
jgi:putative membrane protein